MRSQRSPRWRSTPDWPGCSPGQLPQHAPHRLAALQVITADALHVTADRLRLHNPEVAAPADPTALVANLPYNVAVPVLLHLLAEVPTLRQRAGHGAGRGRRSAGRRAGHEDLRVAEREDRLVRLRPSGRLDRPDGVLAGTRRRLRAGGVRASRAPTHGRPGGRVRGDRRRLRPAPEDAALGVVGLGWVGCLRRDGAEAGREWIPAPAARCSASTISPGSPLPSKPSTRSSTNDGPATHPRVAHGRAGPGAGEDQSLHLAVGDPRRTATTTW